MAKDRKTISIDALLDYANGYLSADYPNGDAPEEKARRIGVINLLEAALNAAGRYEGFVYLGEKEITKSKPGIYWERHIDDWLVDTDSTRRRYA